MPAPLRITLFYDSVGSNAQSHLGYHAWYHTDQFSTHSHSISDLVTTLELPSSTVGDKVEVEGAGSREEIGLNNGICC